MTEVLGLFCGGPAIYLNGVPKPLQRVAGTSLLEQFLAHGNYRAPQHVVVLCDESHRDAFEEIALAADEPISVLPTSDGASTFSRLQSFLASAVAQESDLVHLTYPDVFYAGALEVPDSVTVGDKVAVSVIPLRSRFPRMIIDPYTHRVRSISNHTSPVPANPMHVFGGHLFARPQVISGLVGSYLAEGRGGLPSLEFEFLAWLINQGMVDAMALYGSWSQIDSPRDIARLESSLIATDAPPEGTTT